MRSQSLVVAVLRERQKRTWSGLFKPSRTLHLRWKQIQEMAMEGLFPMTVAFVVQEVLNQNAMTISRHRFGLQAEEEADTSK